MSMIASQISGVWIVYSTVCSGTDKKNPSKLHVTGLCEGNSLVTSEFSARRSSNADNVIMCYLNEHEYVDCHISIGKESVDQDMFVGLVVVCHHDVMETFCTLTNICEENQSVTIAPPPPPPPPPPKQPLMQSLTVLLMLVWTSWWKNSQVASDLRHFMWHHCYTYNWTLCAFLYDK